MANNEMPATFKDRSAKRPNPRFPDRSLQRMVRSSLLVETLEQLHTHSVYKPQYVARILTEAGLPAMISDDSTEVIVGDFRLESVQPEWGTPGISPLAILDFAYRLLLEAEPYSEMVGRGFWFRDVLDKLKGQVRISNRQYRDDNLESISLNQLIHEASEEYRRHERMDPVLLDGTSEMHARNALNYMRNQRWSEARTEAHIAAQQRSRWEHFASIVAKACDSRLG